MELLKKLPNPMGLDKKEILDLLLREEYGYPVLSIDRPYAVGNSGRIRTRVQAFVESIEIKKLQGGDR